MPERESGDVLSARFSHFFDKPLSSIAKNLKVNPNTITIAGFIMTGIASSVVPFSLTIGAALMIFSGFFDVLDGVIARANNKTTDFGAFLDSVLDRYSDAFLLTGFFFYFLRNDSITGMYLSVGTLAGSMLVSYVKARAESLGRDCHTGLMERPERVILLIVAALTGWMLPVMWTMFVLTHATVVQRILYVRRQMRS